MIEKIQSIVQMPQIQNAINGFHVQMEEIAQSIIAIQQIPAPTFAEQKRSDYIAQQFSQKGCAKVWQDGMHNVYGRLAAGKATSSPLIITAHSDTVFPADTPLNIRCEGNLIYGPGIGDNSAGVAGLLALAGAVMAGDFHFQRDIWLVANVGEEGLGDLRGMRAVVEHFGPNAVYIVIEGGLFGQITHKAIGVSRFRLTVEAPGGHSWGDFGSASAVHQLCRLISEIDNLTMPRRPKTTYNIGVIEGGTSINSIAQRASGLLDLRSEEVHELEGLVTAVRQLVAQYNQDPVTVTMERIGYRPAGAISRRNPLVQLATAALKQVGCKQISYLASSTDANIPLSQGIQAVCIGLAESHNAHRFDEYIDLKKYPQGLTQVLLLVTALAQQPNAGEESNEL